MQEFLKDQGGSWGIPGLGSASEALEYQVPERKTRQPGAFPSCPAPAQLCCLMCVSWGSGSSPALLLGAAPNPKPQTLPPVGAQNVLAGAAQGMGGPEDRTLRPLSSCLAETPSSDCAPKVLQCQRTAGTAQSPGTVLPKPESGSVTSLMPCPAICAAADEM